MLESIEIAQQAKLKPIREIAADLGIEEHNFEDRGRYMGKVRLNVLKERQGKPDGKLILVTAMNPTKFGEGKTLTTTGLGQALKKIGKKGLITLREPSLGPVFGIKGGGTGGGYAQVLPMENINFHFTGDLHAITTANNLLAAMLDNHLSRGNELRLDVNGVLWPRCLDMNDRVLRNIVIGLGGPTNGIPRETGFILTPASEVMAILAMAQSRSDLKERLGRISIGTDLDGKLVQAQQIGASNAMAVVLTEAVRPNLVQTIENSPALIHAGPFANIAHGACSVLANRIGLKLADYVVTECGFGADLGAEKFFHIVCRSSGLWPSAAVVVCTCRALKFHGGVAVGDLEGEDVPALVRGLANLKAHVDNIAKFGVPSVVAVNRFPSDTAAEVQAVHDQCRQWGVPSASHEAFARGGEGAVELAEKAVALADEGPGGPPRFMYDLESGIEEKVNSVATKLYGADGVLFEPAARKAAKMFTDLGYGDLPVCMAKTQYSLSDDASALGAPKGWTLRVREMRLSSGAGFLVAVCGNLMLMPALPKAPRAMRLDVDAEGVITGLS